MLPAPRIRPVKSDGVKKPTIREVASVAGVSVGTVSRVLNGKNRVSLGAKNAVQAAIKLTGYRVNPHARNLATSRSNTVAFLLPEAQHQLFDDPNYSMLVRGVSAALAAQNYSLVLIVAGDEAERARATTYITAGHVDGVLLALSSPNGSPALIESLVEAQVPVVTCGELAGFEGRIGCVSADDRLGARRMVRYLAEKGRTRIVTIAGPLGSPGGIGRLEGYRDVVTDAANDSFIEVGDYSRDSGFRAMNQLLQRVPDLDAVFAANDAMAAGAIDALQLAGRRVPGDVSVAGFDDSRFAEETEPPLTTMHQPFDRISLEMVRLLLDQIAGEQPVTMMLPTVLVERHSV